MLPEEGSGWPPYDTPYIDIPQVGHQPAQSFMPSSIPRPTVDTVITQLEPADLMKNRHYQELHNRISDAAKALADATQTNSTLHRENSHLKAEIQSLKTNGNDLFSRRPSFAGLFASREQSVSPNEYNAIRTSGHNIISNHLINLPEPTDKMGKGKLRTKTWYSTWYRREWLAAVLDFEVQQPLLRLCASNWKANHMLGALLLSDNQSAKTKKKRQADRMAGKKSKGKGRALAASSGGEEEDEDGSSDEAPSKKKTTTGAAVGGKRLRSNSPDMSDTSGVVAKKAKGAADAAAPPASLEEGNAAPRIRPKARPKLSAPASGLLSLASLGDESDFSMDTKLDTSFIIVSDSFDDLRSTLLQEYPTLKAGVSLLDAMKASPDFKRNEPSEDTKAFVTRIELSDPNDNSISEDDKGQSWGHYQYTGGGISCRLVLTSWGAVGNTDMARRLIAAAIRTSKVAKYICGSQQVEVASYMSDTYLEILVEHLWTIWGAEQPPANKNTAASVSSTSALEHLTSAGSTVGGDKPLQEKTSEEILQLLTIPELKAWIKDRNIAVASSNKLRNKAEITSAILANSTHQKPTQADVDRIKKKKK